MTDDDHPPTRAIELEVEVPGTPEQVWQAIATGPGISTWFVPARVEERDGGAVEMDFGPGMTVGGRVTRWEPPSAFAYGPAEGAEGPEAALFFEFFVETGDGGGAVVRLVNSGFGTGEDWDGQYDGMAEGWKLFLHNLVLHLTHFAGRPCRTLIVNGVAGGPRAAAWKAYAGELGVPAEPAVGDRVATTGAGGGIVIAGTVERVLPAMVTVLTDEPAPGVALFAAEGDEHVALSLYAYLYGPAADTFMTTGSPAWQAWMADRFPAPRN
jgi:uncharacterized protein YndB with AHSA1/START domain